VTGKTYSNATPEQQKAIDEIIGKIGTDHDMIAQVGVAETAKLQEFYIKIGQPDVWASMESIRAFPAELLRPRAVMSEDFADKLQQAKVKIDKIGESIEALTEEREQWDVVDKDLQLSLAAVRELKYRIEFGIPSTSAKYDLKGDDTRAIAKNLDAVYRKIQESGWSGEAAQELNEVMATLIFVEIKGNQLVLPLNQSENYLRVLKSFSDENTAYSMTVTHLLQAERPAPKAPSTSTGARPS
jgi:hypothetical protein